MSQPITAASSRSQRIAAFDILRGFFLIVILIDHIELYPSGWDLFTGRGRLMVSAAEGFFFMSGLLIGMVYKRRIDRGMGFIFKKMWLRGAQLYVASVILTLLFTSAAFYLTHTFIKDGIYPNHNWTEITTQTLQARYSFGWADFLTRFAKLMVFAPIGFWLLVKRKWWLLVAASALVWTFKGHSFTAGWQVIFFGGMITGFYWHQLTDWWRGLTYRTRRRAKKTLASTAAITFAFSWAGVFPLSLLNQHLLNNNLSPGWMSFTNKWNWLHNYVWVWAQKWELGPLRIVLFMLWFGALFMLVNRYQNAIKRYTYGFIELLGQNSLFVYTAHAFIILVFKLWIIRKVTTNVAENFLITSAALAVLIVLTVLYRRILAYRSAQIAAPSEKKGRIYWQTERAET